RSPSLGRVCDEALVSAKEQAQGGLENALGKPGVGEARVGQKSGSTSCEKEALRREERQKQPSDGQKGRSSLQTGRRAEAAFRRAEGQKQPSDGQKGRSSLQ
ncbi:uncharacterized, partial [Tachysurus ichikawai]